MRQSNRPLAATAEADMPGYLHEGSDWVSLASVIFAVVAGAGLWALMFRAVGIF